MEVLTAIHARRAVRDYRDEPVADSEIASLIDAAIWAPSGVNLQPWSFVVVRNRAILAAWSDSAKAVLRKSTPEHPELTGLQAMLASPGFNIFYNAPALIVICATTSDEMAAKDCCLAAQNLMLAARAAELGACWIGLSEPWLNSDPGKAALGLAPSGRAIAPIIVGRPASWPPPPARRDADVRHIDGVGQP